ncbi:LacI family DNA-binding transcriptional regulator [Streptomyces sp. DSM 44915]|uniref:LacI family DNA-binding transcriptional regulator n=1 Tax=Streptomyces chisholmiae TaxID=3075540 RepID=A0ABU2JSS7_9ACTN|nr:LacI family DNA-binding transcriptional regulator [Streptomyces sp. DSM 44915]MDT0267263.1 LacI family DNA-binding transcriptional regulator [Streptomyces sp. DSM 44915]
MNDGPAKASPTLEDVAREAGVSRATVSRVINGVRNVDPGIQDVVRRAVEATGYVPNRAARSLVTRRAGAVALVVSGAGEDEAAGEGPQAPFRGQVLADPFFGRITTGVVGFLRARGMHPVLMLADSTDARKQVVDYLRQGHADGALLVSTHARDPLPELLVGAGLPCVLFARPARPLPISYVDVAHRDGGALAADHLVARGCQRVASVTGPLDVLASRERLAGFQDAMARHGHPYVPAVEGNFTLESGERAMAGLLAEQPDLDGLFVANDLMAQGALHVLREQGRRVPEQVAVVGFDDSSAAVSSRPALTTVRQPIEEMAAEMTRLLLDRVDQPDRRLTSVIFEPTLVVRQSA